MRLVYVHGIGQGGRPSAEVTAEWTAALERGFDAIGRDGVLGGVSIELAYYGDDLDDLVRSCDTSDSSVIRRRDGRDDELDPFVADLVDDLRIRAEIADGDVRAELGAGAAEKGPSNWEWVHAAGRLLSRKLPWLTDTILEHFVREVSTYLKFPQRIDAIARSAVAGDEPVVVIGHSLGSVVSYRVVTALGASITSPLYLTVGSPLGIPSIKRALPGPLGVPTGVHRWVNAVDERDGVALFSRLDRTTFGAGIENVADLTNPRDRPHWIGGYLADRVVAQAVVDALTSTT